MRPSIKVLEYICNFFSWIFGIIRASAIDVNQAIASWKVRLRRQSKGDQSASPNVELTPHHHLPQTASASNAVPSPAHSVDNNKQTSTRLFSRQHQKETNKTNHPHKVRLYSVIRRLSLRNFMEYCVIALNEASGSGSSNKFDLSACVSPAWLLGQQYDLPDDFENLVNDIRSKLWITYRRNFPPIDDNARYTTDRGFGCMIRCGQMVLANALLYKNLGREWRWSSKGLDANPGTYSRILKLFQDKEECPYSIHNIVRVGQQEGKVVGEWFGPNTIAQALKRISSSFSRAGLSNDTVLISIEAALDNLVVKSDVKAAFMRRDVGGASDKRAADKTTTTTSNIDNQTSDQTENQQDSARPAEESTPWLPGVLFIQLRLGLAKINPLYYTALKKTFQFKSSLGIIGGRPNHALYLIGYTDDDIIYLDPHSTQQYVDFDSGEIATGGDRLVDDLPLDATYHCANPEKMPIERLDPSLALCFYFNTEQEFDDWCNQSNELLIKSEQAPMFEISDDQPDGRESVISYPSSENESVDCD